MENKLVVAQARDKREVGVIIKRQYKGHPCGDERVWCLNYGGGGCTQDKTGERAHTCN